METMTEIPLDYPEEMYAQYSLVELDNYDAEYGAVIWPQPIVNRPFFVKKLYAPPISCAPPLPEKIVVDYREAQVVLEKLNKEIQDIEVVQEKLSKQSKADSVWTGASRRAAKEAESKRIMKEIDALTNKKQGIIDKMNKVKKGLEITRQLIENQEQLEKLFA